jgi:hypothetical protein
MTSADESKFILKIQQYLCTNNYITFNKIQEILTNQKFIVMCVTTNFRQGCEAKTIIGYG